MNVMNRYTLASLKKNKGRTLVTVIGIALSCAMLTAVMVLITTSQSFLQKTVIKTNGNWYGSLTHVTQEGLDALNKEENVEKFNTLTALGYSLIPNGTNNYKPYLYIANINSGFEQEMPVFITEGRLPENENEILIPLHAIYNGGLEVAVGDVINLEIGNRYIEGELLLQDNPFIDEDGKKETFIPSDEKSYTVTGFYERPEYESYKAAGYTALTTGANIQDKLSETFILTQAPKDIYALLDKYTQDEFLFGSTLNNDLLRLIGASLNAAYNRVLFGLGAILISIIIIASIALIYNAFSISLSERTKQFGLLASIGATKSQIRNSILFEGFVLCFIGIPLGVASGIIGISITLFATKDLFKTSFSQSNGALLSETLTMSVQPWAIAIAVLLAVITVLISAYLPARRSTKANTIDALKQTTDIKLTNKAVKIPKYIEKYFGFEGVMAAKNFRRNKKRYRATVASLFISIVLFISASSFCDYLGKSVDGFITDIDYDISYGEYNAFQLDNQTEFNKIYSLLKNVEGVTKSGYVISMYSYFMPNENILTDYYWNYYNTNYISEHTTTPLSITMLFIDDTTYTQWINNNKYDPKVYLDFENPVGMIVNTEKSYDVEKEKYMIRKPFSTSDFTLSAMSYKDMPNYFRQGHFTENGVEYIRYVHYNYDFYNSSFYEGSEEVDNPVLSLPAQEAANTVSLTIKGEVTNFPYGTLSYSGIPCIIYPYSALSTVENLLQNQDSYATNSMYFSSSQVNKTYETMSKMLNQNKGYLNNHTQYYEVNKAIISIVNVFAYGFIALISLITCANVFNTISTNISLRRREFAILESVGMCPDSFDNMMNYECLLYGVKSLVLGLPASLLVCWVIYYTVNSGWNVGFYVPIDSIIIACFSVFLIVFCTMRYSANKLRKESTIETIKNENI